MRCPKYVKGHRTSPLVLRDFLLGTGDKKKKNHAVDWYSPSKTVTIFSSSQLYLLAREIQVHPDCFYQLLTSPREGRGGRALRSLPEIPACPLKNLYTILSQ